MKNKIYYILMMCLFTAALFPVYPNGWAWEEYGEMPFPVYNGESVVYNSQIYIIGGYNPVTNMPTDTIQVFNPVSRSWSVAGRMKTKRAGFVTDIYNDTFIIFGGTSGDTTDTRAIETWDTFGTPDIIGLNDTTNRINATGGIYEDNFYIFGGYSGIADQDSAPPYILEYNIPTHSIAYTFSNAVYSEQLLYQELSACYMDDFYLFGGVFFGVSKKIYKFNITNKTYERIFPDLLEARAGGKAIKAINDKIFIIGGFNETQNALATTEVFKISNQGYQLSPGPSLNHARKQFMTEEFEGYIYIFGGLDENNQIVPNMERMPIFNNNTKIKHYFSLDNSKGANYNLLSNYPNPFNVGTTICFQLEESCTTSLDIYSLDGRKIKTLAHDLLPPGNYQFQWDGTDDRNYPVTSNLYFCKLTTGSTTEYKKMLLLK